MGFHASWVHGNALTVENPENLDRVGHFGWGADMVMKNGKSSWFHVALPTPVIVSDARSKLIRVFLMYETEGGGSILNVHVYDGSFKVQEFNNLRIGGKRRLSLDSGNTFDLANPHTVIFGIGVSFLYRAAFAATVTIPPSRLILAAAGGDYTT
jgi:hypothetical protein